MDCYLTKVPACKELLYFKYLSFGKYFSDLDILGESQALYLTLLHGYIFLNNIVSHGPVAHCQGDR